MLQWYGNPCVLGIPIPKTLVISVSPVTLTLTQIAKVMWDGDAQNAGMFISLWQRYSKMMIISQFLPESLGGQKREFLCP